MMLPPSNVYTLLPPGFGLNCIVRGVIVLVRNLKSRKPKPKIKNRNIPKKSKRPKIPKKIKISKNLKKLKFLKT